MGHHSCCNQQKVKRGLWSPEEDEKLIKYITTRGYGCWSEVPEKAGLQRCGKSCRLRWINYLRPDIRRGRFSLEEEKLIISLHGVVGNRWAHIASHLPGRTDNEIKNYWNSWIKKKIRKHSSIKISSAPTSTTTIEYPLLTNYASNIQTDLVHQDLSTRQETIFSSSSSTPLFMFDTTTSSRDVIGDAHIRGEIFYESTNLNTEKWSTNHHHQQRQQQQQNHQNDQVQNLLGDATFSIGMDTTYLPPLIENMVTMGDQMQSCSIDEEGEMGMECLQRQEVNEWVESQQCSNFLFWENINGPLGGQEIAHTSSSNMGAALSSFPSSL